jgi:hypothetical protein
MTWPFTPAAILQGRRPAIYCAWLADARRWNMLFALFLIVTSGSGLTTTLVGNFKDRAACEAAAKSTTVVIKDAANIGFVTICIEAPAQ